MLLDPPGWPGMPQGLPHWPYVQAVDHALGERGVPPGMVRANCKSPQRGHTVYMTLEWDASRVGGRFGIRLYWGERRGWSYAVLDTDRELLLYGVLTPFRSLVPTPAAVAEQLVCSGRAPESEREYRYRDEWDGAPALRTGIRDFHRTIRGLSPMRRQDPAAAARRAERIDRIEGTGAQVIIDTETDTYEQALAAVQAAYGRSPDP